MTVIASVTPMFGHFPPNNRIPLIITSGIPSSYEIRGAGLAQIESVNWYPENPGSLKYRSGNITLVDDTRGSFMIEVLDNYLDVTDRRGRLCFKLYDGNTISYPVQTIGPVSAMPLWTAPTQGLITG